MYMLYNKESGDKFMRRVVLFGGILSQFAKFVRKDASNICAASEFGDGPHDKFRRASCRRRGVSATINGNCDAGLTNLL